MIREAKRYGIKVVLYRNQGKVSEWQDAMNRAIAADADAIFLGYAPDPKVLQPQIIQAKQRGIPTISSHWYDTFDATNTPANVKAPNLAADVPTPFTTFARLEVLWAIKQSNCNAHMVFQYAVDADPHKQAWNAAKDELAKTCPDTCSLTPIGLPYVEWPTKSQSAFQSAMTANPDVNWLIPFTDIGTQYAVAAIRTAGKTDSVKIATFNGTPAVFTQIKDDDIVSMDAGENLEWLAYAYLDQVMRVMAGVKPLKDHKLGIRMFHDGNIAATGDPPSYRNGYGGKSYITGYRKLWSGRTQ
jgi:ribose transport system substrate-binding protein